MNTFPFVHDGKARFQSGVDRMFWEIHVDQVVAFTDIDLSWEGLGLQK